jgi:predicted RNA-binding protein
MCQATVYLDDEQVMQDVIWLEPAEEGFRLRTFFGEPLTVKGTLKGIDLLKHRVLLTSEALEPEGGKS